MLTRFFAFSDRLVFGFLDEIERRSRPPEIWNGTPEHLRGRPLPPEPTPAQW